MTALSVLDLVMIGEGKTFAATLPACAAALAGSAFYGLVAWIEARMTFWHPSQRK